MKKKLLIIIPAVLAAAAAALAVFFVLSERTDSASSNASSISSSNAIAYFEYMDSYMLINKNGVITGSSFEKPADIPMISGVDVSGVIVGEKVQADDTDELEYAVSVVVSMATHKITGVSEVYITTGGEAIIYVNKVKILLGKDEDTDKKIGDLKDFYASVVGLEGTLNMQEVSDDDTGYTFKIASGNES